MVRFLITFFGLGIAMVGCHNHPEASEDLKTAFKIQKEALKINQSIDEINFSSQDSLEFANVFASRKTWLENMIEIPNMEHDHSNCNHDHSRPSYAISDKEMISVQQSWKDSIVDIKKILDSAKK